MNAIKGFVGGLLLGSLLPLGVCWGFAVLYGVDPSSTGAAVYLLTLPSALLCSVALGLAGAARDGRST